ncbi:MAG TPA: hypothetical protein VIM77_07235 [Mucilaginibacter sp.]
MKLFYHFLFFVATSLILLVCASMFASDPQGNPSQTDEFNSPESFNDGLQRDDSTATAYQAAPFASADTKKVAAAYVNYNENNKGFNVMKKYSFNPFQLAVSHFHAPQKFK